MWKARLGDTGKKMEEKDKVFYDHVVKNRSDASLNSIRNPVPDYYGEKVGSLREYRGWLRKQREHQRKAMFHIGEEQ